MTQCLVSLARARKPRWILGIVILKSPLSFSPCPTRPRKFVMSARMTALERYTVLLYDRTSTASTVNEARKQLFTRKGRQFDALPPTRAALVEHVKRTVYQAGNVWGQSLAPNPSLPSPQGWGWDARMAGNGDPSVQRYQRSPNHASSWPSVAARVPAVDVVDVARSV